MSKFSWIPEGVEDYINKAVKCRIERWRCWGFDAEKAASKPEVRRQIEVERRRHKYMGTYFVRQALVLADFRLRMSETAPENYGDLILQVRRMDKRLRKEIARRYTVIDRAYGAEILRMNGEFRKVSK